LIGAGSWFSDIILCHERLNAPALSEFLCKKPRGASRFAGDREPLAGKAAVADNLIGGFVLVSR
jgi:hypothetical protein